jgi:DNA mismatch endonuclease (patch repair protein)
MQGNRSRDTKPEVALRAALHALGLRYRVTARPLPEVRYTADIVFRPARVAVFLDGCFWHGCQEHGRRISTHTEFWSAKIERNQKRDTIVNNILIDAGWVPIRVWEHEPVETVARNIAAIISSRRNSKSR